MTPIEKNIAVTDETGNHYEPTYWKRAKGLVKHGRARWVDEWKICLSCPPEQMESEGNTMEEKVFNYIKDQIEFIKADLNREIPLNMDSQFQPGAAAQIAESRAAARQQIIQLLGRLMGDGNQNEDKSYYRQLLEKIATDNSSIEMVKSAVAEMDDDDCKQEVIDRAVEQYELSKREIAEKIMKLAG